MKKKKEEFLNLKSLKERGWTDGKIKEWLKEPDYLKRNPVYGSAAPQKMYSLTRIKKQEKNKRFIEWKAKRDKLQEKKRITEFKYERISLKNKRIALKTDNDSILVKYDESKKFKINKKSKDYIRLDKEYGIKPFNILVVEKKLIEGISETYNYFNIGDTSRYRRYYSNNNNNNNNKVVKIHTDNNDNYISLKTLQNLAEVTSEEVEEINIEKLNKYKEKDVTLLIGQTGSGKTYTAINENDNFIIAVPARQLAYELILDYEKITKISTGEVHLDIKKNKEESKENIHNNNMVAVYENLSEELINQYDTLIIDEAHYISDGARGGLMLKHIIYAIEKGKKVILMTATDNIHTKYKEILNIKVRKLDSIRKVTKTQIKMKEGKKLLRARKIEQVIVFTKYKPDYYTKNEYSKSLKVDINDIGIISADTPSAERLETQIKFKKGELKVVLATNVLAQGLNFPADFVIIESNKYDDWAIIHQKIGRVGRPFLKEKGYYCIQYVPEKQKNKKPNFEINEKYSLV